MNRIEKQLNRYDFLYREMMIIYDDWAKAQGVSYNEVMILVSLHNNRANCTQKRICNDWFLPKQTVNTIICEFKKRGYIVYTQSESDRRQKNISLTPEGLQLSEQIVPKLRALELTVFERLGETVCGQMLDAMELYIKHFRSGIQSK